MIRVVVIVIQAGAVLALVLGICAITGWPQP